MKSNLSIFILLILIYSVTISGQINLVHTFPEDEDIYAYSKNDLMYYIGETSNNQMKIYNSDFTIYKTVNIPIPSNFSYQFWYDKEDFPYSISKNIFNNDDLFEFLIAVYDSSLPNPLSTRKLYLINEDGLLLYNFTPNSTETYGEDVSVYYDPSTGFNKIIVYTFTGGFKVFSLPSNLLNMEEEFDINSLSIYPNPSEGFINIVNPNNQVDKLDFIDMNGRVLKSLTFDISSENIRVDTSEFQTGTYIIKIGNYTTKYMKK